MANLLTLTMAYPMLRLERGETLIEAGEARGELYVLASGRLKVERDGVEIARIAEPGTLVGEMRSSGAAVLLVEQDLDLIRSLCDRVYWMNVGHVEACTDTFDAATAERYLGVK